MRLRISKYQDFCTTLHYGKSLLYRLIGTHFTMNTLGSTHHISHVAKLIDDGCL